MLLYFFGDGGCVSRRQPTAGENLPHSCASEKLSHRALTGWMWWLRGSRPRHWLPLAWVPCPAASHASNVGRWMSIGAKTKGTALTFPGSVLQYMCGGGGVNCACLPKQAASSNCGYREYIGLLMRLWCHCVLSSSSLNETILPGWGLGRMWFVARVVLGCGLKGPIMSTHFPTQTQLQPYVITLLNEPPHLRN